MLRGITQGCCAEWNKEESMKFVMYNDNQPGILTDAGVIDIGDICPGGGQAAIVHLVTNYDDLKSRARSPRGRGRADRWRSTAGAAAAPQQGPLHGRELSRVRRSGALADLGVHQEPPQHPGHPAALWSFPTSTPTSSTTRRNSSWSSARAARTSRRRRPWTTSSATPRVWTSRRGCRRQAEAGCPTRFPSRSTSRTPPSAPSVPAS